MNRESEPGGAVTTHRKVEEELHHLPVSEDARLGRPLSKLLHCHEGEADQGQSRPEQLPLVCSCYRQCCTLTLCLRPPGESWTCVFLCWDCTKNNMKCVWRWECFLLFMLLTGNHVCSHCLSPPWREMLIWMKTKPNQHQFTGQWKE